MRSHSKTTNLPFIISIATVLDLAGFGDVVPEFLHVPGGGGAAFKSERGLLAVEMELFGLREALFTFRLELFVLREGLFGLREQFSMFLVVPFRIDVRPELEFIVRVHIPVEQLIPLRRRCVL